MRVKSARDAGKKSPDDGGHAGFATPPLPGDIRWLAQRLEGLRSAIRTAVVILGLGLIFGPVLYQVAALHPYQNVYFNRLAGEDMQAVKQRFDLDYWGLSYREGLEYILRADSSDTILVYGDTPVGVRSAAILGGDGERRLRFVQDPSEADYFLGNYRWHPEEYTLGEEIYAVKVGNAKILSVRKLK